MYLFKYNQDDLGKITATSAEVDQLYKSAVLCFIELICKYWFIGGSLHDKLYHLCGKSQVGGLL